jgi:hypothetical protein
MNGYLKKLAGICGFKKDPSIHMAQHTFAASVILANEVISTLTPSKNLTVFTLKSGSCRKQSDFSPGFRQLPDRGKSGEKSSVIFNLSK